VDGSVPRLDVDLPRWGRRDDLDEEPLEEAYGTPPLSIEWDLARRDHEAFALIVYSMTYEGLIVAGAGAAPPVGFRVEGMLLHEPPADETSI